jgi:TctA family transporter
MPYLSQTFFELVLLGIITLVIAEGISGGIKQEGRHSYFFAKITGLGAMIFLVLINQQETLKLPLFQQGLALVISFYVWGTLIKESKNRVGAILAAISAIALGQIISKLDILNTIIPLSIALYGIPPLVASLANVKQKEPIDDGDNSISGLILGFICGVFMGIPPSALGASLGEGEAIKASTEGMASAVGLLMAVAGLGARSIVADNISSVDLRTYALTENQNYAIKSNFCVRCCKIKSRAT